MNLSTFSFNIWAKENPVVFVEYQKDNFFVKNTNQHSKICIIFFSGNGLYFPNTEEEFNKTIIQNNRYEWEHITLDGTFLKKTGKLIFVRDVYKQWYVRGINANLNTIEKVVNRLKEETVGYHIITTGSSAGGYAAVLFGILLNAQKIFTFSGQFSLYELINKEETPFLFQEKNNTDTNRYFDLTAYLKTSTIPVYYFFPYHNEFDYQQAQKICGIDTVYSFKINAEEHGKTVLPDTYKYLFFTSQKKLAGVYKKLSHKIINPENLLCIFSIRYKLYSVYLSFKKTVKNILPAQCVNFIKHIRSTK